MVVILKACFQNITIGETNKRLLTALVCYCCAFLAVNLVRPTSYGCFGCNSFWRQDVAIFFNRKNEGTVLVSPYAGYTVLNAQGFCFIVQLLCSPFVISLQCIVYDSFLRIKAERKITFTFSVFFCNRLIKDWTRFKICFLFCLLVYSAKIFCTSVFHWLYNRFY